MFSHFSHGPKNSQESFYLIVTWFNNQYREGGSGWGTHVNPWLIHVNVWQKPL